MKKFLSGMVLFGMLLGMPQVKAEEPKADSTKEQTEAAVADSATTEADSTQTEADSTEEAAAPAAAPENAAPAAEAETAEAEPTLTEVIKEKIVQGGTGFMSIVLVCLILGLAIAIERIITLNLTGVNTKALLSNVKDKLSSGDVDGARMICAETKGPIASIFAQGLLRLDKGIDQVEHSIESHGAAELSKLEKGMTWISLFISLAPMFGFMGTVIGMIGAFESIEQSEDIVISEVAKGIKVALLTTVAGLVVAVILQVCYNYLSTKIESITSQMEDASNSFVDMLVASENVK